MSNHEINELAAALVAAGAALTATEHRVNERILQSLARLLPESA